MKLNRDYLKKELLEQMHNFFSTQEPLPHILLPKILESNSFQKAFTAAQESEFDEKYKPLDYRRAEANCEGINQLLNSEDVKKLLSEVLGKKVKKVEGKLHLFAHSMYQLLDADKGIEKYMIFLDLTPLWEESWGGSLVWRSADGESFTLPTTGNSLFIVERPTTWKHFISYCNHEAQEYAKVIFVATIKTQ